MQWLSGVFSGDPGDMSRIGMAGLCVTAVGLIVFLAGPRVKREWALGLKVAGLLVVALGALMTMKII